MDTFVKEKDKIVEQQLPGSKFGSGNTTLFQITASKGTKLGQPQMDSGEVSERDKEILAKAIPANRIESVLRAAAQSKVSSKVNNVANKPKPKLIKRGMVVKHNPTGQKVTVLATEVDTDKHGKIRHEVCVVGTSKKYKVLEENLEVR
jgi:hypothetical protein